MIELMIAFIGGCILMAAVFPKLVEISDKIKPKAHGCHDCKWRVKSPCGNPEDDYYIENESSCFLCSGWEDVQERQ